jgi:hypothetical protein
MAAVSQSLTISSRSPLSDTTGLVEKIWPDSCQSLATQLQFWPVFGFHAESFHGRRLTMSWLTITFKG